MNPDILSITPAWSIQATFHVATERRAIQMKSTYRRKYQEPVPKQTDIDRLIPVTLLLFFLASQFLEVTCYLFKTPMETVETLEHGTGID